MDLGFTSVYIDYFTPCLNDITTEELIDTEVIRINGQMSNYNSYMENAYTPIDVNTLPYFVDMKAMRDYAKAKGVAISSPTDSEKEQFVKENLATRKASSL